LAERGRIHLECGPVGLRQTLEILRHQRGVFGLIHLLAELLDLLSQTTDAAHGQGSPVSPPLAMV